MSSKLFGKRRAVFAAAAFLALTAATFGSQVARGPAPGSVRTTDASSARHRLSVGYDGSANSYELGAENDSSSDPFGVFGIEGYVPYDVGGVGVLGYGQAAKSYGVYGVTFGSNGIGVYGAGQGPTPAPNTTPGANQSTGVVGDSHSGDGVYGSTEFPNSSNGSQVAGVVGVDGSTSTTENEGVLGISAYGRSAVAGYATNSTDGVYGVSGSGNGVYGYSSGGNGVTGENLTGLFGGASPAPYVYDDTGVYGVSVDGSGLYGESFLDPAIAAQKDCNVYTSKATDEGQNCSGIWLDDTGTDGFEIEVYNSSSNTYPLYSNSEGDLFLSGALEDENGTFTRSRNTSTDMLTYSAQQTESTVEDFGSAHLIDGEARVALGGDFRQTIDGSAPYMVFLTPYGDSRGLYIASRNADGFVVRESQGGRSSMSFDYRIVARPYGARQARLPHESVLDPHPPRPLSPSALARHRQILQQRRVALRALYERQQLDTAHARTYVPQPNFAAEFRLH